MASARKKCYSVYRCVRGFGLHMRAHYCVCGRFPLSFPSAVFVFLLFFAFQLSFVRLSFFFVPLVGVFPSIARDLHHVSTTTALYFVFLLYIDIQTSCPSSFLSLITAGVLVVPLVLYPLLSFYCSS